MKKGREDVRNINESKVKRFNRTNKKEEYDSKIEAKEGVVQECIFIKKNQELNQRVIKSKSFSIND